MRILLDGDPIEGSPATSVVDAIETAAARADANGRLIVEIRVDGVEVSDRLPAADESHDADEVCLVSADRRELVAEVCRDAAEALKEADRLQQDAAAHVQADRADEGMGDLSRALEIWGSVQQATGLAAEQSLMLCDPDDCAALQTRIRVAVKALNEHLSTIRNAIQLRDPSSISDTLLYDLPDVVQDWRALLFELNAGLGVKD
jgi:hypothetical protein